MATKLYVGNLSYDTTEEQIRDAFAELGAIESCSLITDRATGRSKGFAFVEMTDKDDALQAIEQFHGIEFNGRTLNVNEARPREDRGPSRGGYGGGGGGRGGGNNRGSFGSGKRF